MSIGCARALVLCALLSCSIFIPSAQATLITPGAGIAGQTLFTGPDGTIYTATGGTFTYQSKCTGCPTGVGINGGGSDPNGNEISIGESLLMTFSAPMNLESILLAYLYPAGVWDNVNESVGITFNGTAGYTFIVTGSTTASFSLSGSSVTNLQPATGPTNPQGGYWQINLPGSLGPVTSIQFTPLGGVQATATGDACTGAPSTFCSDFQFVGVNATASVPEPVSFGMLGLGLLVIGARAVRRRRS